MPNAISNSKTVATSDKLTGEGEPQSANCQAVPFKTQSEYCSSAPNRCPKKGCGSDDIDAGSVDIEGRHAVQEVSCNDCGCTWDDTYALDSYEVTEYGDDIEVCITADAQDKEMKPFTVIGVHCSNAQIFSDHVLAHSRSHAFYVSASKTSFSDADFICALDGHFVEGNGIDYAGQSSVDTSTILEQQSAFS